MLHQLTRYSQPFSTHPLTAQHRNCDFTEELPAHSRCQHALPAPPFCFLKVRIRVWLRWTLDSTGGVFLSVLKSMSLPEFYCCSVLLECRIFLLTAIYLLEIENVSSPDQIGSFSQCLLSISFSNNSSNVSLNVSSNVSSRSGEILVIHLLTVRLQVSPLVPD